MYMLFPLVFFTVLLFAKVESWPARVVMGGIVFGLWAMAGILFAGISAAILSIGILIAGAVPSISKL